MTSNPTPPEGLPAQPARRRHNWLRNALIMLGVLVVLVIILVAVGSGHNGGTGSTASPPSSSPAAQAALPSSAAPADSESASASAPSPPAPTMTSQTDTVVFRVSGSGLPSIQYGSDSNSNNPGSLGPLGNGNALPWTASMPYSSSALYYAATAQLQGDGEVWDSVTEVVTTRCSNGSHRTESFSLASGHASGGYAIAQAEYAGGDTGNAAQAESDTGC